MTANPVTKPLPRGLAAMSKEQQRAIASKGGQAVPPGKRSFSLNRLLASNAGRKGGSQGKKD